MRKTSNDSGYNHGALPLRRIALTAAATLLAGALATGCSGGSDSDADHAAKVAKRAKTEAPAAGAAGAATQPTDAADKRSRLAEAVVDSKTTAPVDMKYDVLAKPALGHPFEVELTFETRLPAESLDIELTEAPGLTIVGQKTAKFDAVEGGQAYTTKVLVQGDKSGLYYIGVVAKMSTQVQTEARAFAIPIVIGNPVASQKSNAPVDATGQAIQSMPAQEPK